MSTVSLTATTTARRGRPDGTITGHRLVVRDDGVIGDQGWIDVAPPEDMTLFTLGAGEA